MKRNLHYLAALVLVLYGLFIRVYGLGMKSFWLDENISALAARAILERGLPYLDSGFLYSRAYIFHYIQAFFLLFSQNEFNARLFSALIGTGSCVLVYFLGRTYSRDTATFALIMSLFLEIEIVFSRQARMYQMLQFLFLLSLYIYFKALDNKRFLVPCIISFLIAYETHPIAAAILPLFAYLIKHYDLSLKKLWYTGFVVAFLVFIARSFPLDTYKSLYFLNYMNYLIYYVPFILVAGIGAALSIRKRATILFLAEIILVLIALSIQRMFAFRYIYIVFPLLIIFAAYAISKIGFRWPVFLAYILLTSNLVFPLTYSFVLKPEAEISHFDITMPGADYRAFFQELETNLSIIATTTPPVAWYYRNPDYWLFISFTGTDRSLAYHGRDWYSGARAIHSLEEVNLSRSILIIDSFGASRLSRKIINYLNTNCTVELEKRGVKAYLC